MTLEELSTSTGIPEKVLLEFASGRLALSACDRLAVISSLTNNCPSPPFFETVIQSIQRSDERVKSMRTACEVLVREAEDEMKSVLLSRGDESNLGSS